MNSDSDKKFGIEVYDVATNLSTEEDVRLYLQACLDEGPTDAPYIAHALGTVARSQGMTGIAQRTGLSRESLYKSLSGDRSPTFDTVLKVLQALGLELSFKRSGVDPIIKEVQTGSYYVIVSLADNFEVTKPAQTLAGSPAFASTVRSPFGLVIQRPYSSASSLRQDGPSRSARAARASQLYAVA